MRGVSHEVLEPLPGACQVLTPGLRVEVYWNLHKLLWSVRHKGRVLTHVDNVELCDVTWVVQPSGRRRVIKEGRKNVHAFARGYIADTRSMAIQSMLDQAATPVTYNPYRDTSFVEATWERAPIKKSKAAVLTILEDHKGNHPCVHAHEPTTGDTTHVQHRQILQR